MKSIICAGEKLAMLAKRYKKATITSFILLFVFNYSAIGAPLKEKDKKEILNKAYTLRIPFIENKGQIKDEGVRYYAKTFGGTLFITKDGKLVYSFPKFETKEKVKGWVIKEGLVGASISNLKGEEKAVTKVSYFKGKDPSNWKRNISTYNLISLGEVYKGIEVNVKAYGKNVEKLFYIKAGADPESIKIKIEGAKSLKINEAGELEVETGLGVIKFTKPVAYQEINGKRVEVAASYTILSDSKHVYGLKVGSYDKKETLIIDPLLASTFIGGSSDDYGHSIALDKDGNVYITGVTYSPDYPTTSGADDKDHNGYYDVFVSKLDRNLTTLLASTFIGGSDEDWGYSIALDADGNVYITGRTQSPDYPTTSGAYDESFNVGQYRCYDVFVSKLDSNLTTLLASTFIGGNYDDGGCSIAHDAGGNVYVTGWASAGYPITSGAYDESFNSSLTTLLASTYIGGSVEDYGYSIALDAGGNVYITGGTSSSDYPTTPYAYDESYNGWRDVFVSKLDSNLSAGVPPTTNSVFQYQSDDTEIPEEGIILEGTIVFKATLEDPDGDDVRLEIELRKIGEPFTGEPTSETISDFVPSGSEVTITRSGFIDGEYHWQYRVKDSKGTVSEWKEFGETGNVDFKVSALLVKYAPVLTFTDLEKLFTKEQLGFSPKEQYFLTNYKMMTQKSELWAIIENVATDPPIPAHINLTEKGINTPDELHAFLDNPSAYGVDFPWLVESVYFDLKNCDQESCFVPHMEPSDCVVYAREVRDDNDKIKFLQ